MNAREAWLKATKSDEKDSRSKVTPTRIERMALRKQYNAGISRSTTELRGLEHETLFIYIYIYKQLILGRHW
jgi:hypothetical protein